MSLLNKRERLVCRMRGSKLLQGGASATVARVRLPIQLELEHERKKMMVQVCQRGEEASRNSVLAELQSG